MDQTLTAQRRQIEDYFVGRSIEIHQFETLLKRRDPNVILIEGVGGIGKTWLLHYMRRFATQRPDVIAAELIDLYAISTRHIQGLEEEIITAVSGASLDHAETQAMFPQYMASLAFLDESARRDVPLNEQEQMVQRLSGLGEDLKRISAGNKKLILFFDTFEKVRHDPVGGWLLNSLPREADTCLFVIAGRPEEKPEKAQVDQDDSSAATSTQKYHVFKHTLRGLKDEEQKEYLKKRNVRTENARNAILHVGQISEGSPLLIELAIEWLGSEWMQKPDEFAERLSRAGGSALDELKKILMEPLKNLGGRLFGADKVDQALFETLLLMAFFNRRFNADLLGRLQDEGFIDLAGISPKDMLETLGEMFFIKYRPQDNVYQIQDEMEQMLVKFIWSARDPSRTTRKNLSRLAFAWYDEQMRKPNIDPVRQGYLLAERLYYRLILSLPDAWDEFFDLDNRFIKRNENIPLSVIEMAASEIRPSIKELPYHRRAIPLSHLIQLNYLLGELSIVDVFADMMIDVADKQQEPDLKIWGLIHKYSSQWRSKPEASYRFLDDALALAERNRVQSFIPRLLYLQGFSLRNMQKLDDAIGKFSECQKISLKQGNNFFLASALNDQGYSYAARGKFERAKARVKLGQHYRKLLLEEATNTVSQSDSNKIRNAGINLGWSYNTLAEVNRYQGQLAAAQDFYRQAYDQFQKYWYFEGMAIALMARCDTLRRIALAKESRNEEGDAKTFWDEAAADIQKSMDLFNRYKLQRGLDTAHRRYGRYLRDRYGARRLDEAEEHFKQGLQIAKNNRGNLEILENLMELAFLAAERGDEIELEKNIKEMERYHRKVYQWEVFPRLADLARGNLSFKREEYNRALEYYLNGYTELAKMEGYGSALYISHRHRLFMCIQELPTQAMQINWMTAFVKAWDANQLADKHEDLLERFQLQLELITSLEEKNAGGDE